MKIDATDEIGMIGPFGGLPPLPTLPHRLCAFLHKLPRTVRTVLQLGTRQVVDRPPSDMAVRQNQGTGGDLG